MRSSLLVLVTSLATAQLGLAAPVHDLLTNAPVPHHMPRHVTRARPTSVEIDDEHYVDPPRLDNREYTPTSKSKAADVLAQEKPVPTWYLLSLESSSSNLDDQNQPHSSRSRLQTGVYKFNGHANPDVAVIGIFTVFLFIIAFLESRHRALVATRRAKNNMSFPVGPPGPLRLEGDEKRSLALAQPQEAPCPKSPRTMSEKAVLVDLC